MTRAETGALRDVRHARSRAIAGSVAFLLVAPGIVAGLIPWLLTHWRAMPPFFDVEALVWLGIALIAVGIPMLLDSFARFAWEGLGVPAPIYPTETLVVTGLYRHVRNPMYVGVASTILGQGLLFGNFQVIEYGAAIWLAFHLFVLLYEEPTLRATFGDEYREFCAKVPRWIPRPRSWPAA